MAKLTEEYEHLAETHPDCKPGNQELHNCSCHISPPCSQCTDCPAHNEEAWVKHEGTCTDEDVRGHRGTVARCSCGWKSSWSVMDGSAEADLHGHMLAEDEDYAERNRVRAEAWASEQKDKGCSCQYTPGAFSYHVSRECFVHSFKSATKIASERQSKIHEIEGVGKNEFSRKDQEFWEATCSCRNPDGDGLGEVYFSSNTLEEVVNLWGDHLTEMVKQEIEKSNEQENK